MNKTPSFLYFILTLSVLYAFVYPSYQELNLIRAEKEKFEQSLQKLKNIEDKTAELLSSFNQISESDKKEMETILPLSLDFVKMVSQIDAVGSKYGISIDKISSTGANLAYDAAGNEVQGLYQSATINFSFTTSYESFRSFLAELEKSLRILDLESLKVEAGEKGLNTYMVEFEMHWIKSN